MSEERIRRLEAELARLTTQLSGVKKKVKVDVKGPNSLDDCLVEGWAPPISGGGGEFVAEDEVLLIPQQIAISILVTGPVGTNVTVSATINGITTALEPFTMTGQQQSKDYYPTFSDFNLPTP